MLLIETKPENQSMVLQGQRYETGTQREERNITLHMW